jgi:hypothetical protein
MVVLFRSDAGTNFIPVQRAEFPSFPVSSYSREGVIVFRGNEAGFSTFQSIESIGNVYVSVY